MHVDTGFNDRKTMFEEIPWYECKGNMDIATHSAQVRDLFLEWAWCNDKHYAPRSTQDIGDEAFFEMLKQFHSIADLKYQVASAVVVEHQQELREELGETLDRRDEEFAGDILGMSKTKFAKDASQGS